MAGPLPLNAYAVCTTPRTGSNYLCDLLEKAGLGVPDEYLNPLFHNWKPVDFDNAYELTKLHQRFDTFGIKLHWGHRDANHIVVDFDELHENMKWIYLRRLDTEAQARSYMTALCNGGWNGSSQPYIEAPEWKVDLYKRILERRNADWRAWFRRKRITPLKIVFEKFITEPNKTVERIREFVYA